jgi:hypothetical protein
MSFKLRGSFLAASVMFLALAAPGARAADDAKDKVQDKALDIKDKAAETKAIVKLEQQWAQAMIKKDVDFLKSVLDLDFTAVDDSGELANRTKVLEEVKKEEEGVKLISAEVRDVSVRFYGPTAIAVGMATIKYKIEDEEVSSDYRFTDVWVKRDAKWIAVASHYSEIITDDDDHGHDHAPPQLPVPPPPVAPNPPPDQLIDRLDK